MSFENAQEIQEYILTEGLPEFLTFKCERRSKSLYLPQIDMTITPEVQQIQNNNVGIGFNCYLGDKDKPLFEYSAGLAGDIKSAVGISLTTFLMTFMNGIDSMYNKIMPREFTSEFAGREHKWNAYLSNVAGMGKKEDDSDIDVATFYWDILKDEIIKRLGNQKLVYVKVYAAKYPQETVGEVRIDNVAIPELGKIVEQHAAKWNTSFASDKQFFFIEQDESTILPDPYEGTGGRAQIRSKMVDYLILFEGATTREKYSRLVDDAADRIGDRTLAQEFFSFLPEIAAMHALGGRLKFSDMAEFNFADDTTKRVYLSQLSDYTKIDLCLGDILSKGDFGDETDKVWKDLLGMSSVCNMVEKVKQGGSRLEDLSPVKMIFNVSEGFELR